MTVYLRTSERSTFKRCRQQWHWAYNDRLKPHVENPHLRFGDLVHQALALYYKPGKKRGPRPHKTFTRLYTDQLETLDRAGFRDEDGKWRDMGDLGESMLKRYCDRYHDHDLIYRVIASEQTFQWPIKAAGVIYAGTFDGVWEDMTDETLLFPEHKTASAIRKTGLGLDEQGGSYWTYGPAWLVAQGLLKRKDKRRFKGIMYNFLRKAVPDPDAHYDDFGRKLNKPSKDALIKEADRRGILADRKTIDMLMADIGPDAYKLGEVSKSQPPPFFHREWVLRDEPDRRATHQRIIEEAHEMEQVRAGEMAVYKNPGPWFRPNCDGCPFKGMCELHEIGADWEAFRDGTMGTWDPYEAHNLDPRDVFT